MLEPDGRRGPPAGGAPSDPALAALIADYEEAFVAPFQLRNKDAGRERRRQASIAAYVGANGSGKSLAMVHDTLPDLHSGRRVLSTVRLVNPLTGLEYPNYERLTEWSQILDAEHTTFLFDEVVGIAGAREHSGLPVQVANILVQLRRRDNTLRWSAPNWARADKIIRETSQAVTVCRGYWSDKGAAEGMARVPKLWRPKRLFKWRTYAALDFEEWTAAKEGSLKAEISAWFYGPRSEAFYSYETMGAVSAISDVTEAGTCARCGGTRRRPACSCHREPRRAERVDP